MSYEHQLLIDCIKQYASPLNLEKPNYSGLLDFVGDARIVLIGEASHGTEEFYQLRAELSRELIKKKGFMAIAIEGDWPDAHRLNHYLTGQLPETDLHLAFNGFQQFPTWMWRNQVVSTFIQWLRRYNDIHSSKVGIYGLDLYSLNKSMQAVFDYLSTQDPKLLEVAQQNYGCFDHNTDPQAYGSLIMSGLKHDCRKVVTELLLKLQHRASQYLFECDDVESDAYFYAMQNARIVKDAENYYRTMFKDSVDSWNLRDRHMAVTLTALATHLEDLYDKSAKIIVWAHNSHVGDARATEMADRGELNLGELIREQYGHSCRIIGFSTYNGSVMAANNWGNPGYKQTVNDAIISSYEAVFHETGIPNFWLDLTMNNRIEKLLSYPRLQRAIGVVYRPDSERSSHYYFSRLAFQFDAIIHIDHTNALTPLKSTLKMEKLTADER